jgi:hypothetical protein
MMSCLRPAEAQVDDSVIVYGEDATTGADVVLRFDRNLNLASATFPPPTGFLGKVSALAVDGLGRHWITWGPLGSTDLFRMDNSGAPMSSVTLGHNPVFVVSDADGRMCALTRIPLSASGPMYSVDADGTLLWSNPAGLLPYLGSFPQQLVVTTSGELWIGGVTPIDGRGMDKGLLVRVDTATGDVLQSFQLPDLGDGLDELLAQFVGAPDGTMWAMHGGTFDGLWRLVNTDGEKALQSFPIDGGSNSTPADLRMDGQGRLYIRNNWDQLGQNGDKLLRYNPADPSSIEATYSLGGFIQGYALGATGEDVFAVISELKFPFDRRFERINLVTGVKSSVPLDPVWFDTTIARGDPTGFIYANVVDRGGDNDGDGAPNGAETAAGSNPFDAQSRPEGPKVHIGFTPANAIMLTYEDPDGLLDPVGGLDLTTLSLTAGNYGEVFSFLVPFLNFVDVSPDGTKATAVFGGLPLAAGLKIELEAAVADLSGAVGWDWQVTPPGDL